MNQIKNKIRNPFPKIGKVMKYEFKHSTRRILPLYGIILVLSLIGGIISAVNIDVKNTGTSYSVGVTASGMVTVVMILVIVSIIMTLVVLSTRFKKSMYEDEAYVNLSLPVTIGEHLWGRFLTFFVWFVICGCVISLSGLFCYGPMAIRTNPSYIVDVIQNLFYIKNGELGYSLIKSVVRYVAFTSLSITFIFLVHSIASFVSKNKGLVEFAVAIGLIIFGSSFYRIQNFWLAILLIFLRAALYFGLTHFILSKKMDLE